MILNLCIFGTFISSFIVAFIYTIKYENPRILHYSLIDKVDLSLIPSISSSLVMGILLYSFQNIIMQYLNNKTLSLMFPNYNLILMAVFFIIGVIIGLLVGHLEKFVVQKRMDRKLQIAYEKELLLEIQVNNDVQTDIYGQGNRINELTLPYSRIGHHNDK